MRYLKQSAAALAAMILWGCASIRTTQWGTPSRDYPQDVAVNAQGTSFVAWETATSASADSPRYAKLSVVNSAGTVVKTTQIFNTGQERIGGVAIDQAQGVVYVGGTTGTTSSGFLARFNFAGDYLGGNVFPLPGPTGFTDIAVGSGFVWMVGFSAWTPYAVKLNLNGSYVRGFNPIRSMGYASAIAVNDVGQPFIAGVLGDPSHHDPFLVYLTVDGDMISRTQWGSFQTYVEAIAVDKDGGVYVGGHQNEQAYVARFNWHGQHLGTTEWGSPQSETIYAVGVDAQKRVFAAGSTGGVLFHSNAGGTDAFITALDANGAVIGTTQWGSAGNDEVLAGTVDAQGKGYLVGSTTGSLSGQNAGLNDAFLSVATPP